MEYTESVINRISSCVIPEPNTGCILWTGNVDKNGYGKIYAFRKYWRAHRLIYYFKYGPILKDSLVCHKCDTPSCVNIEHLFLGSFKENMQDKVLKGRLVNQWTRGNTCKRGHSFNEQTTGFKKSTSTKNMVRYCKLCSNLRKILKNSRKKMVSDPS